MVAQRLINRREHGQMNVLLTFQPWIADSMGDIILTGTVQRNPVVLVAGFIIVSGKHIVFPPADRANIRNRILWRNRERFVTAAFALVHSQPP